MSSLSKHKTQTPLVKYQDIEAFRVDIQESLAKDFRNLLTARKPCPRKHIDKIYKTLAGIPVTEASLASKRFSAQLASEPSGGDVFHLQDIDIPLDGDPDLIRGLRQTLGFFSRLHANVTKEQELSQLEEAAERLAQPAKISWTDPEIWVMRQFIRKILGPAPDVADLKFRHGPGAVATGEKGFEKLYFKETYQKVDQYLGYDSEVLLRLPHQPYRCLERTVPRTRVIAVPKDALRIRTISCEPLTMMFLQQGIMCEMYRRMYRPRPGYSQGALSFPLEAQALQQRRAQMGSECRSWGRAMQQCCIDLSNASDDVKCEHVTLLFPRDWAELLMTFRSSEAHFEQLDRVVTLETFAPMGAATCFPTESLVFGAICFAARFFARGLRSPEGDWGIVGDDCCQPSYAYPLTLELMDRGGFHPNLSKCCGPLTRFRESCGGDFFEGVDVTYVRPRFLPKPSYAATAPMVSMANGLLTRGFRITAQTVASACPGYVALGDGPAYAAKGLKWPNVGDVRWNRRYQRFEQKAMVEKPCPSMRLGAVDGWEPLFNWFTSGWLTDTSFSKHTKTVCTWLEQPDPDVYSA